MSKKQTKKQTGGQSELAKTNKPKSLSDYAEFFRKLPDTQRPLVGAVDDKGNIIQGQKLPYRPTEWWILNAGADVHGVLRLGGFKEFENQLLAAYGRGGPEALWKEFILILRRRANLPYIAFAYDYLKNFAEDCGLVADAILAETAKLKKIADVDINAQAASVKVNSIIKGNSVWQICFEGLTRPIVGNLQGLPLIEYLLQNPNKPISAFDLERAVTKIPSDKAKKESDLDLEDDGNDKPGLTMTKTGRSVNLRALAQTGVDTLKMLIATAEAEQEVSENPERKLELGEHIDALKKDLIQKTNKWGKARPEAGDPYEQARVRVIGKTNTVREHLKNHEKLYDHFGRYLKIAAECSYKPPEDFPNWQVF